MVFHKELSARPCRHREFAGVLKNALQSGVVSRLAVDPNSIFCDGLKAGET